MSMRTNPVKLLNQPAIQPDAGCCAKFGAFIIASFGVLGLATAAFAGPIVGGTANAAGNAVASTAAKVVEAVSPAPNQPSMWATISAAYASARSSAFFTDRYESRCTSFTQSLGCSIDGTVAAAAGIITIAALGFLLAIATGHLGKSKDQRNA